MAPETHRRKCSSCGKIRVILHDDLQLCKECWINYQNGSLKDDDLKPVRRRGRPADFERPPASEPETDPEPEPEEPEAPPEDPKRYFCDYCEKEIERATKFCPGCGAWNNWKGTDVYEDPDILVCPECGAVVDEGADKCPKCYYRP